MSIKFRPCLIENAKISHLKQNFKTHPGCGTDSQPKELRHISSQGLRGRCCGQAAVCCIAVLDSRSLHTRVTPSLGDQSDKNVTGGVAQVVEHKP
jgi:hypothetical protein